VFINAAFDGTYFTIYGTSYHPGWPTEATLKGEGNFFGTGRNMYSFKAMSQEGSKSVAKLYLALPLETATSTTGMWTNDSVGTLFGAAMVNNFNDNFIGPYLDNVGYNSDMNSGAGDTVANEQTQGNAILEWMFGVGAPEIATVQGAGGLTLAQLKAFINNGTSNGADQWKADFQTVTSLINPAFYDETVGFVGTLEESSNTFYKMTNGQLVETSNQSSISAMTGFDLSGIQIYTPAEVKAATIIVE